MGGWLEGDDEVIREFSLCHEMRMGGIEPV